MGMREYDSDIILDYDYNVSTRGISHESLKMKPQWRLLVD